MRPLWSAPVVAGVAVVLVSSALVSSALVACSKRADSSGAPLAPDAAVSDDDTLMCDPGANADPSPPPSQLVAAPLIARVNPFIGTGGVGFNVGSTFPGPQRPFGMARPGPDTTTPDNKPFASSHCSGYAYDDAIIAGFSQIRASGTGIIDYGNLGLMPTIGMTAAKQTQAGYREHFSHANEKASPGYYAVTLDSQVKVELTATDHVALHRYTFPSGSDANVVVDVAHVIGTEQLGQGSTITVDAPNHEMSGLAVVSGGYSGRNGGVSMYFVARFSRAFKDTGSWASGASASFDTTSDPTVEVAVGLSFVDVAHARKNLDAEIAPFDEARAGAEAAWETALGRVQIEARTDKDATVFYTALYHTLLMPTLASDVDGSYRGIDQQVATAQGFRYYTDFSLWDTYRSMHPWIALVYPEHQRDFLASLVAMGKAYGAMPRWPLATGETGGMLGDSAAVVFADSLVKGIQPVDYAAAYDLLWKSANGPLPQGGRGPEVSEYIQRGYISVDSKVGSSASKTLEYAIDDAALANMADALGHPDDAATLRARSKGYAKLYDPSTGFLAGRYQNGAFVSQTPIGWQDWYAEGDAWQYTFLVPHDPEGLAQLMGGRDAMLAKLEQLFTHSACKAPVVGFPWPYYWAGNEPDIVAPWLFSAMDDWARTARYTRWIVTSLYGDGPDGLPGNDDSGELSSWLLFAASGFYPNAGSDVYLLGSPIFTKVTMHLAGGDLVIAAPDASPAKRYVGAATWNGQPVTRPRLTHEQLARGGTLQLTMRETP